MNVKDKANSDLITVIVPVYNVEKYLNTCVQSIVNQEYKNLEIILIDDGSKDHSLAECKKWELKDSRIRVLQKENGGVSSARNLGLDHANGKYIAFVDSDDEICDQYISILYNTLCTYNVQVVECFSARKKQDLYEIQSDKKQKKIPISIIDSPLLFYLKYDGVAAWNKLYDAALLQDIRFEDGALYEDYLFTFQVFQKINKFVKVWLPLYYWNQTTSGLSRSPVPTLKNPYQAILKDLKGRNSSGEILDAANMRFIRFRFSSICRACQYGFINEELKTEYEQNLPDYLKLIRSNRKNIMTSLTFSRKEKAGIGLLCVSYNLFVCVYKMRKKLLKIMKPNVQR